MRTLTKVNPVTLSFFISFVLAVITAPLTMSLTNGYDASLSTRALLLIIGMGIVALVTIVIVLILALLIQSFYNREIDQLHKDTLKLRQYVDRRRWEHRFATYYQYPNYQKSQVKPNRKKFTG